MKTRRFRSPRTVYALWMMLAVGAGFSLAEMTAWAQTGDTYIPATKAFDGPGCSDVLLGGITIDLGLGSITIPSPERTNPEWKTIILDPTRPSTLQPPAILEGFVLPTPDDQTSSSQSTAEVAEEDISWTHFTHDYTFKVIPDSAYQHLLSSWVRIPEVTIPGFGDDPLGICVSLGGVLEGTSCVLPAEKCTADSTGTLCLHTDMEVEWDSASLMDEKEGFERIWGAAPEFVWPAVGDRVWVQGRWIFDCGHPSSDDVRHVKFSTEIHPPRALVTFRLNHIALDSFPRARVSAPNFPAPQSWLPVTGEPAVLPPDAPNSGPTNVPVTEADIFISGNGGAANDVCSLVSYPCSNYGGHTPLIIPVNDRNYVFDVYPPGTDFLGIGRPKVNGTFDVAKPVPDASLQWRFVDHSSELPAHTCGFQRVTPCTTVEPIVCLLDSSTPPPNQTETGCPPVPPDPTRLRIILPFAGSAATFFARSILLGWDDVPTPPHNTLPVRTFKVRLHQLTINSNGAGHFNDGDWRVFLNIGGQWRYMSSSFDTDANNGAGILQFDGGNNKCHGDALTENGDGDCFQFDNTPFTISVQDTAPIHVAVGGFVARGLEDSGNPLFLCRSFPGGCDSPSSFSPLADPFEALPFDNDDRIGTYEFDLVGPDYSPPAPYQTKSFDCAVQALTGCELQYQVEFRVNEVPPATPPASAPLVIGPPSYSGGKGTYISATTPIVLQSDDPNTEGFQYRFHRQESNLPDYSPLPAYPGVPVHWARVDRVPGTPAPKVYLGGANSGEGSYDFEYSAESFANLLEPRNTTTMILDSTPPVTTIAQPQAISYVHSATLTLNYSISDGDGSGVATSTPTIDGTSTLPGNISLENGQPIHLLTELPLGIHTFRANAVDNVGNAQSASVIFTIVVTPDSIKDDVRQFLQSGAIKRPTFANLLLTVLKAAARQRQNGHCAAARALYNAFLHELQVRSGKSVDASAAEIMMTDARYLIAHCP
jgi:hypothetical protein